MVDSINPTFVTDISEVSQISDKPISTYADATDLSLLMQARQLDEGAIAEIHGRYYQLVYRFVASKIGAGQLAEDYASDVFVRFIRSIRQKTAPQNSLKGWLYRVASNIVNDHFRREYRRGTSELSDSEPSKDKSPEELIQQSFSNENLIQAMNQLGEIQQKVISLRFAFEMSVAEVAQTIGKSETAVRQIQFRGIKKLAEIMGDTE